MLGYRLRRWFLLLVYDGLNLYAQKNRKAVLTSFSEPDLARLVGPNEPKPVSAAALQSLNYIRNYHLKYFFAEERRIRADSACHMLEELVTVA